MSAYSTHASGRHTVLAVKTAMEKRPMRASVRGTGRTTTYCTTTSGVRPRYSRHIVCLERVPIIPLTYKLNPQIQILNRFRLMINYVMPIAIGTLMPAMIPRRSASGRVYNFKVTYHPVYSMLSK